MGRSLDTKTLDGAARQYAAAFLRNDRKSRNGARFVDGPSYVMQDLYNLTYKDAHEYIVKKIRGLLGSEALREFEARAAQTFTPRSDEVFADLLRRNLAIDTEGRHVPGAIGRVEVGKRKVGTRRDSVGRRVSAWWPIYAGEEEERAASSDAPDPLPEFQHYARDEHLDPIER